MIPNIIRRISLISLLLCSTLIAAAQVKTDADHIRRGNKYFADSLYDKAEIEYRKALELNPQSADAMYNLGNTLINQIPLAQDKAGEKGQEAMKQYSTAIQLETDKKKRAQILHNMGTLMYMAQQYGPSVEAYKESLRNNPSDNETRDNLAKAMHMLQQQQQQNQQQQQEQQQQEKQEQEQQQQEQQEQEQEQEQQEQQQEQTQQEQQEQQQEQQQQQQEAQEQQAQQSDEEISEENAEQMLNAVMQDEKDIQEKVKKMQQQRGKTLEKDW